MSRLIVVSNCLGCIFCDASKVEPVCKAHEQKRIFDVTIASITNAHKRPIPDWCPLPVDVRKS